jgi:thiamine kinase-like enzyme
MHRRLEVQTAEPHLLVYDADFFRLWLDRARAFRGSLGSVEECYEQAVDRLAELPRTVIHGELYPSNVIVAGARICPVDWELAGVGPGLLDLAALTTGWEERERSAIVEAYGRVSAFDLDCCRLHLAVRWLGWCEEWTPPRGHAHDWLAEAVAVSERLRSMC